MLEISRNNRLVFYSIVLVIFNLNLILAQNDSISNPETTFLSKLKFGGGLGLAFGNGYSDVTIAPNAYYPINNKVIVGFGILGSYVKQADFFRSFMIGPSVAGIINPIPEMQLSAEIEELYVQNKVVTTNLTSSTSLNNNFWNTALFLGAGYNSSNATIGIRYNVLYKERDNVYSQAWMPFVRVMF